MGLWDVVKASLKAGVRNPGDVGGTLRDFRNQQADRGANAEEERTREVLGEYAVAAFQRAHAQQGTGPWETQFVNADIHIKVKNGYSADRGCWTTEIGVFIRRDNPDKLHLHIVFDEKGNEIFREWRRDREKR